MNIKYVEAIPGKDEYHELFETTGWNTEYRFNATQLLTAISNSWYAVSAYNSGRLVGFGRVICDGVHHALIVDLIVAPPYQGKGIGSNILKMLVNRCTVFDIKDVQLFCAKGKANFYTKFGFRDRPADAPGMQLESET